MSRFSKAAAVLLSAFFTVGIIALAAPPPITPQPALLSATAGWSCEDFPCEGDIDGWLQRIGVPAGFEVEYAGKFPGQPMQIAFGADGRLYATVLERGTRYGAVYALNADGTAEKVSQPLISPVGLAFQPETGALFVTSRITETQGGALWRIDLSTGEMSLIRGDLPCCRTVIDQQPEGITFGVDGYLYIGVGALTDRGEPTQPERYRYATPEPFEASILRVDPATGDAEVYAGGLRDPYDIAFDPNGVMYATDNGTVRGLGDRVLKITQGAHYRWPFYRSMGCEDCPPTDYSLPIQPDMLPLPSFTLPRGLTVYEGDNFPSNYAGSLFVAFWNGIEGGQRVVRLEPSTLPTDPEKLALVTPEPFVTGLIRPVDVAVSPDGALLVADFIYGQVWRVVWTGEVPPPTAAPVLFITNTPQP